MNIISSYQNHISHASVDSALCGSAASLNPLALSLSFGRISNLPSRLFFFSSSFFIIFIIVNTISSYHNHISHTSVESALCRSAFSLNPMHSHLAAYQTYHLPCALVFIIINYLSRILALVWLPFLLSIIFKHSKVGCGLF